ncbi:MAG TPA: YdjY domain-containing protein [Deltaproteobacteria bacterium]|nr:YdjY domain-containing protein [Deltaproteobacteria bacterium]
MLRLPALSRRAFLVSMLVASGAAVLRPDSLPAAATPRVPVREWSPEWPARLAPLREDVPGRAVKIYAELSLKHLTETTAHWGIGCSSGSCADKFIFTSPVEPAHLYDALCRIGARPGNNLTLKSYGQHAAGDELALSVQWSGLAKELSLSSVILDEAGKGLLIRFGGNRAAALEQKTGCLTCLESCPVAITSNSLYPHISGFRRAVRPNSRFRGKPEMLPNHDLLPVVITYRLAAKG